MIKDMKSRLFRRGFAFALGLLIALGMSLSAVQATGMAVKMALAAKMDAKQNGDCSDGCGAPGHNSAKGTACTSVCVTPIVAVLSPALSVTVAHAADVGFGPDPRLHDWVSSPDPYPPRSKDLG